MSRLTSITISGSSATGLSAAGSSVTGSSGVDNRGSSNAAIGSIVTEFSSTLDVPQRHLRKHLLQTLREGILQLFESAC